VAPSPYQYGIVEAWPTGAVVELYRAAGWWRESATAREAVGPMIAGSFAFLVVTEGDRTIAMGRAISDGASDAYIQDVVVLPEYRGRGIGAEIVSRLARHCTERGLVWIGLVAEPGTTAFYERLGFRVMKDYVPMRYPTPEQP
jgi:ribosomal protein S18 acetylase RimI-like enzyme